MYHLNNTRGIRDDRCREYVWRATMNSYHVATRCGSGKSYAAVQFVKNNPGERFIIAHMTDDGTKSFQAGFDAAGMTVSRCTSSVNPSLSVVEQIEAAINSGAHVVIVTHAGLALMDVMPTGWHLIVDEEMTFDRFFVRKITANGLTDFRANVDVTPRIGSQFGEMRLTSVGNQYVSANKAYGDDDSWLEGIIESLGRGDKMFTWTDQWVRPEAAKDGLFYFKMFSLMNPAKYQTLASITFMGDGIDSSKMVAVLGNVFGWQFSPHPKLVPQRQFTIPMSSRVKSIKYFVPDQKSSFKMFSTDEGKEALQLIGEYIECYAQLSEEKTLVGVNDKYAKLVDVRAGSTVFVTTPKVAGSNAYKDCTTTFWVANMRPDLAYDDYLVELVGFENLHESMEYEAMHQHIMRCILREDVPVEVIIHVLDGSQAAWEARRLGVDPSVIEFVDLGLPDLTPSPGGRPAIWGDGDGADKQMTKRAIAAHRAGKKLSLKVLTRYVDIWKKKHLGQHGYEDLSLELAMAKKKARKSTR